MKIGQVEHEFSSRTSDKFYSWLKIVETKITPHDTWLSGKFQHAILLHFLRSEAGATAMTKNDLKITWWTPGGGWREAQGATV